MAGWVPSKKSIGGIYDGRDFLTSAMTYWLDYLETPSVSGDWIIARWNGGGGRAKISGTIGDAFIAYKMDHTGGSNNLICEFKVKTPANANFKKQTICCYMNSGWDYRNRNGQVFYDFSDVDFSFTKKIYYNDDSVSETSIGSQRTAAQILGRYVVTWLTDYGERFSNPNDLIFSTGNVVYNDNTYFCFGVNVNREMWGGGEDHATRLVGIKTSQLATIFDVEDFEVDVIDDPNYDENDIDDATFDYKGGDGTHDDHSDDIDNPDLVDVGGGSSGICMLYFGGTSVMQQFADFLYSDNLWTEIKKCFSGALEWIVSCSLFPLLPDYGGAGQPQWGNVVCPVSLSKVQKQFKKLNCGSILIDEYWGNCFDYSPYTRIEIWLPYIGYRELPVDEIMGKTINLEYQVDFMTGDCAAILSVDTDAHKVLEQWTGNVATKIPLAQVTHDGLVNAALQQMIGGVQTILNVGANSAGDEYGAIGSVVEGLTPIAKDFRGTTMAAIEAFKPKLQRTRANGSTSGFMCVQTPYIVKHVPIQSRPDAFMELNGYMSDISGKLGDFEGYTEVETIRLENVAAYEDEINEIISLLQGGVIV